MNDDYLHIVTNCIEKRDPTLKNYSHKWMVYVVEPPQV